MLPGSVGAGKIRCKNFLEFFDNPSNGRNCTKVTATSSSAANPGIPYYCAGRQTRVNLDIHKRRHAVLVCQLQNIHAIPDENQQRILLPPREIGIGRLQSVMVLEAARPDKASGLDSFDLKFFSASSCAPSPVPQSAQLRAGRTRRARMQPDFCESPAELSSELHSSAGK